MNNHTFDPSNIRHGGTVTLSNSIEKIAIKKIEEAEEDFAKIAKIKALKKEVKNGLKKRTKEYSKIANEFREIQIASISPFLEE